MLRFRKLRLKNWKNFESVDIDLRDRMFLVGPNASGKSNLLDAFRFLPDTGIGLDETLLFTPKKKGTGVSFATSVGEIGQLLEAGLSLAEIVIPRTRPADVTQLALFADAGGATTVRGSLGMSEGQAPRPIIGQTTDRTMAANRLGSKLTDEEIKFVVETRS